MYASHVTADVNLGANAAYQPQPSYAKQQSYSSLPQQQSYASHKPEPYSYRQQSVNLPKQQSLHYQQPHAYNLPKQQAYSSYPQQASSGFANQLPYNLPGDFADSKLEHPIYYDAKPATYSYDKKTITVLPTLYIPPLPSHAPSANSYQSHHPADIQNVDAQPSYYPSTASQSVLPSHSTGYATGSNDLYKSPYGSW